MRYSCPNCSGPHKTVVRTYKHEWFSCNACGTVVRESRQRIPLDNRFFRTIIRNSKLSLFYGKTLLSRKDLITDDDGFYDEYPDLARQGVAGTKWETVNNGVLANLNRYGIKLQDASVLDISGGPGFLVHQLRGITRKAVVTEFSPRSAEGMRRELGIDAVKFDYNSDKLEEAVGGKWDIVFVIYSLGFCNDLRGFLQSLKAILHEGSIVYICYSPPTVGLMMRWQFDDYTYTTCWPIETMTNCFAEIGMTEFVREDEGSVGLFEAWFNTGRSPISRFFQGVHRVICRYYLRRAKIGPESAIDTSLTQKNIRQVFRFAS